MADPIAILERRAQELYDEFRADRRFADPFDRTPRPEWCKLANHDREVWRAKALGNLRSDETLADELKREDRERRTALAL